MGKATVRLSLKTIAMKFPPGSIERVYLHGAWQRERGRNPSMLYGNHTDMIKAFEAAKEIVGPYFTSVFALPFSRQWDWNERLVAAIMERKDVKMVRRYVW